MFLPFLLMLNVAEHSAAADADVENAQASSKEKLFQVDEAKTLPRKEDDTSYKPASTQGGDENNEDEEGLYSVKDFSV